MKFIPKDKTKERQFIITGVLRNGKRFKPITTTIPQHYNIYKGSLWELINNKRKLIRRIY